MTDIVFWASNLIKSSSSSSPSSYSKNVHLRAIIRYDLEDEDEYEHEIEWNPKSQIPNPKLGYPDTWHLTPETNNAKKTIIVP